MEASGKSHNNSALSAPALYDRVVEANQRIRRPVSGYEFVYTTPLRRSARLELRLGCGAIYLKFENIQRGGSFKMRGATNAVAMGHEEDPRRVFVAASAGNHGLGVAVAAKHYGHLCHIFMPTGTPLTKKATIGLYTSNIELIGDHFDETQCHAIEFADSKGYTYIHPYNDPNVVAGQGTVGLELIDQFKQTGDDPPDNVLIPVGGGGLASGIGCVLRRGWPTTKLIAVEPEVVPSLTASYKRDTPVRVTGQPTLAEGVAVAEVGDRVLPVLNECIDEVRCVTENAIATAIVRLVEDVRIVAEGAGAIGLAALTRIVANDPDACHDKSFVVILSGGNLDITALSNALQRGLALESRRTHFQFTGRDAPGLLAEITSALARLGLNIIELSHTRYNETLNFGWARVDVVVETEGAAHAKQMHEKLRDRGFDVRIAAGV